MKHTTLILILLFVHTIVNAQNQWRVEAEGQGSNVSWQKDGTADIIAPKGLTLWNTALMQGDIIIDYDARIVVDESQPVSTVGNSGSPNRLSDLNCFWLASDPKVKNGSVFTNMKKRGGVFANQYALQMYYMGYGGNHNSTTRFRRYNGNEKGITDTSCRPLILREYTDAEHLLKPNHWYHIHIEQQGTRVLYSINDKVIVDYVDINPHKSGYFGFRTTLAHAQLRNFTYSCKEPSTQIPLHWVGAQPSGKSVQTFGVPFMQGEFTTSSHLSLTAHDKELPHDEWTLASWPDGSVKWRAVSAVIPQDATPKLSITKTKPKGNKPARTSRIEVNQTQSAISVNNGNSVIYIPKQGPSIIDSIVTNGIRTARNTWLEYDGNQLKSHKAVVERQGEVSTVIKIDGDKFTLRLYFHNGSDEIRMVHTLLVDSVMNANGINSLGLRINVPMHDTDYKRGVAFARGDGTFQYMHVKPLIARRPINLDSNGIPADARSAKLINDIASWDGFRLSQLSPNAFSIRKRATGNSPWIGTMEGHRASGEFAIGDDHSYVSLKLDDFWQSYPSTLQVDNARSDEATATVWLWSPEAERMSFKHYDTIPHTLEAAYEDIQPGFSTAYGIARTSTIRITPTNTPITSLSDTDFAKKSTDTVTEGNLLPTPSYLHAKQAFGVWSLPGYGDASIDSTISKVGEFYDKEVERNYWYGYFNYGDFMHSYDKSRGEWRYDVGGYAWDNTELATNAMLWYSFLRSGEPSLWRMAVAMSRHTAEVDCYHSGPHAGLGSRHNVSHWGCGAKEARISQAFWNRFLYYLTADDRSGDLMREAKDADTLLYTLDPMRLAQPRSAATPCTAPARLRVGPDWLAYAGNWFTEWERTGNTYYYNKVQNGMNSIASLPHGLFSGPKALGYDPKTGVVSWEGNPDVQNTNHLLSIMGGFEMMNEMLLSIDNPLWSKAWLTHAAEYKEKALQISRNNFRIPRLKAYAWWKTGNKDYLHAALEDLKRGNPFNNPTNYFTNDFATWTLDAIFLQEVNR